MPQDPQAQDPGAPQIPGTPGIQTGRPSNTFSGFIQSMVNIHAARQNQATAELDRMLTAAHAGFPVDPKAVEKSAKKAGIPLMHPDDMKGLTDPQQGGKPTQSQTPQKNELGDTINKPDPYNVKAITDVKDRQKAETNHAVDGMIRQSVTNAQLRGADQQAILEHTKTLLGLKTQALNGDPRALGKLAQAGEMSVDVPTNVWQSYNSQQKWKYLEMTRGAETDAQKASRIQASTTHLLDTGQVTDPEAATQIATVLADGGALTPELKAKMKPVSLESMVKETQVAGNLAAIGLSGTQIAATARGANLTGLGNYFPKNFQTIQQQEIAARNKQLGISQQEANAGSANAQTNRMQVTGFNKKGPDGKPVHVKGALENQQDNMQYHMIEAENTAKRIDAIMTTKADKDFIAQYAAMVDVKRSGGVVDPDVLTFMQKKLVEKAGGQVSIEQVQNWWNIVSWIPGFGGTHAEMKMGASPQGVAEQMGMGPNSPAQEAPPTNDDTNPAQRGAGEPQQ